MADNKGMNPSASENGSNNTSHDYIERAHRAIESGNALLGMYLYLAAFEESAREAVEPSEDAVYGLKEAWALACANKERSLAEYIFERLEPYLNAEEISACATQLQDLALDKLEEFGLSRDELEEMAQMLSDDFLEGGDSPFRMDQIFSKTLSGQSGMLSIAAASINPVDPPERSSKEGMHDSEHGLSLSLPNAQTSGEQDAGDTTAKDELAAIESEVKQAFVEEPEMLTYENIAGYQSVIRVMRDLGIGMDGDPHFRELVGMLNEKHGLTQRPAPDSILFRSQIREDANRFTAATLGELKLPAVHMRMEENFQGLPVLCISAHEADLPHAISLKNLFAKGGVLILEDLDLWESPVPDSEEEANPLFMMQLTRGAKEAVDLIRSSVENPDVYVIATASTKGTIDEFFLELIEPLSLIDITYPTEDERADIWMDIAKNHPSIRSIDRADLVKFSANLARYDIYMASREAIEEAYKQGLMTRTYQPVTRDNIFDKLAAYQPLDSREYGELEDEVVRNFQTDLDHIDDLLDS